MQYSTGFFIILSIILFLRYRTLKIISTEKTKLLENKCQELQNALDKKEQSQQLYLQHEQINLEIENSLLDKPSNFYWLKSSLMTPIESGMFYYITKALDVLIHDEERKNYYVFPQVALHSFVNIHNHINQTSNEYNIAKRNFVAKSIDFVICYHYSEKKTNTTHVNHYYKPILLIEIDGNSHFSSKIYGTNVFARQEKSDIFKNTLAEKLHIPLLRYVPETIKSNFYNAEKKSDKHISSVRYQDFENIKNLIADKLKL